MQNNIGTSAPTGLVIKKNRVDPLQRQAELAAIVDGANAAIKGAARRDIGTLSYATARDDDDGHYFGQLRSEPLDRFGGLEFRFHLPACDGGRQDVAHIVGMVVDAVAKFRAARTEMAAYADSLRKSVDAILQANPSRHPSARVVGLGLAFHAMGCDFDDVVDIEMLGDGLQLGIDRVHDRDDDRFEKKLTKLLAKHTLRADLLAKAKASRGIGWIDALALRLLDEAGLDRRDTIDRLLMGRGLDFYWEGVDERGGDTGYSGSLYFQDGVIRCNVEVFGTDSQFLCDTLTTKRPPLPETVICALPGQRFGAVFEHPFIPADAIITEVEDADSWLYVHLAVAELLIDEDLATINAEGRCGPSAADGIRC